MIQLNLAQDIRRPLSRSNSRGYVTNLPLFDVVDVEQRHSFFASFSTCSRMAHQSLNQVVNGRPRDARFAQLPEVLDYVEELIGPMRVVNDRRK